MISQTRQTFSVGRSRLKYALVQVVLYSQCDGSKKKRWPNQWAIFLTS